MAIWVERSPGEGATRGVPHSRSRTFDADHWIIAPGGHLEIWKGKDHKVATIVTGDWTLVEVVPDEE